MTQSTTDQTQTRVRTEEELQKIWPSLIVAALGGSTESRPTKAAYFSLLRVRGVGAGCRGVARIDKSGR